MLKKILNKINSLYIEKHIGWIRVLLFVFPYQIVAGFFVILGSIVVRKTLNHGNWSLSSVDDLIITSFGLMGTLLSIWLFMKFIDKEKFIKIGLPLNKRYNEIFLGIGIGATAIGSGLFILLYINEIQFQKITFNLAELIAAIMLFLIVAVNEEILLRGYVLKNLMVTFNKYIALLISAILFAIMHTYNQHVGLISLFNLFLAGLVLGSSYLYTKNLWFPISLHFSWNFFQSLFGFNVSGRDCYSLIDFSINQTSILNGGLFGYEGSILSAGTLIIIFLTIVNNYKKLSPTKN